MSVIETACSCGEPVVVRTVPDAGPTCRADGKIIHYPGDVPHPGQGGRMVYWCIFRCRKCGEPINETCADAEFGEHIN